ncbi:capsid assembly scaffolding protein Gp46 family protein [Limosilactobacillus kribbianus]|uniref:capsid assembly scaffolding protein Gp46 family protein n=1 Tax=Limosilactobacillus kribbianus TaxID=2982695 RepID=UPI002263FDEE|nr:DUF4355 domain-containing protein [Limosilactobacillus kribbianus]
MNGNDKNNNQDVVEPKENDQQQEQPKEEPKEGKNFTREELANAVNAQVDKVKSELTKEFKKTLANEVAKAREDGEKRAKMSADERAEADRKALQEQLAQERADIEARERKLNTRDALAAAGLHIPAEDVDLFVQKDIDTTHRMIDRFKALIQTEVKNEIHQRTANKEIPKSGVDATKTVPTTKSFDQMSYMEKRQLFQEDPAAYQALKDKSAN